MASNQGEAPQPRKSSRVSTPSTRYLSLECVTTFESGEPGNFDEAMSHKEKSK